ncbi:MAG: glycoside hydrolase family 28 protein [Bacteroidales bacterium]|nr:glycoside hydrolase family 28 protein [Bacteroidales bacterium]
MRKENIFLSFIILIYSLVFVACNNISKSQKDNSSFYNSVYKDIEFEMKVISEPSFPDYSVNIADFGAIGDGQTINTNAIADAIQNVIENGGGKIIIPRGIWLTGPIIMKSNINLFLEEGALILFSDNFDDYPLIETSFEGLNTYRCISPIYAKDVENIAITGKGVIDGSGNAWRPVKKSKLTESQWKKLITSGGVLNDKKNIWYPSEKSLKGAANSEMNVPKGDLTKEDYETFKDFLRPVMVSIVNCKKILLDGPTFQNSPAWNIHPLMCEDIIIKNITVKNPWYAQNGDGIDLESCKNAIVFNCDFDVGDDAICLKSGKNESGRARGIPTENVIIKECIIYHGHGGFVVGSEMSGGVKNIHVSKCTFIGTDVGIRFKSTRGRGGIVENIHISYINMIDIPTEPIRFNLYYGGRSPVPEPEEEQVDIDKLAALIPPVTEETPQFKDVFIRNIVCKGASRAIYAQGLPEMNLKNIIIENAVIKAQKGAEFIDVDSINLINVEIESLNEPLIYLKNAKNIFIKEFRYDNKKQDIVAIEGIFSENIYLEKSGFTNIDQQVIIGKNVKQEAIMFVSEE